jgi:hypothetical protein
MAALKIAKFVSLLQTFVLVVEKNMTAKFKPTGKRLPTKTRLHLEAQELAHVDPNAYKARCKVELSTYRNVKTATDVVMLGQTAINSLIADTDGDVLDIKKATALGYLMAIQLTAIKMAKSEQNVSDGLSDKVRESQEINLTQEEMKVMVYATNSNIQLNVINRAAERPDAIQEKITLDKIVDQDMPDILKTSMLNAIEHASGHEEDVNGHINEDLEDFEMIFDNKDDNRDIV